MESARLELARWEVAAATDELKSFAANTAAAVPRKALGNLYFAAFHLVQALLASRGVAAHTHNGVQVAFSLHFVRPGTVSRASAKLLSELQAVRERADYQVDLVFDGADVRRHLESAAPLIEELAKVAEATPGVDLRALRAQWNAVRSAIQPPAGARPKRARKRR
jgi:uncharacterized protein (UPF0332 family)